MKRIDRIRKSSDALGPGGFENAVAAYAQEEVCRICTCKEDRIRDLYMNLKGNSQGDVNIILDAHSDEVRFVVRTVENNGPLRFLPLGSWDVKNIITNKVFIKNRDGKLISGIVCSKPVHFMNVSEQGKTLDFADVLADAGAMSAQKVQESLRIGVGASIVPSVTYTYDREHQTFMGKASDNRIGYTAVVETLCQLRGCTLANIISTTLPSREEVGERGTTYVVNNVKPDVVVCLEGCPAGDSFEEEYMIQSASKKGPVLRHFDRPVITSPRFQCFALELTRANDTPVRESVQRGGGTNSGVTHMVQFGTPTIAIGVPVRYAHPLCGILAYQGYEHAVELATQIVEGLSKDIAESFWFPPPYLQKRTSLYSGIPDL